MDVEVERFCVVYVCLLFEFEYYVGYLFVGLMDLIC